MYFLRSLYISMGEWISFFSRYPLRAICVKVGHVSNDGGFIAFLVNFCFHLHKFINRDFWGVEQEVVYLGLDVCAKDEVVG